MDKKIAIIAVVVIVAIVAVAAVALSFDDEESSGNEKQYCVYEVLSNGPYEAYNGTATTTPDAVLYVELNYQGGETVDLPSSTDFTVTVNGNECQSYAYVEKNDKRLTGSLTGTLDSENFTKFVYLAVYGLDSSKTYTLTDFDVDLPDGWYEYKKAGAN